MSIYGVVRVDEPRVYVTAPLAQVIIGGVGYPAAWFVGHRVWASNVPPLPKGLTSGRWEELLDARVDDRRRAIGQGMRQNSQAEVGDIREGLAVAEVGREDVARGDCSDEGCEVCR